jgi:hypothetical protein
MFRFTIRDVLWLTVVVALGVGWWASNRRTTEQLEATVSHAESLRLQLKRARDYEKTVDWARRGYTLEPVPPDFSWIDKPLP